MARAPKPPALPPPTGDPLDQALKAGDGALFQLMRQVVSYVQFPDFAALGKIEEFRVAKRLATWDLWSAKTEEEKAAAAELAADELPRVRGSMLYREVRAALERSFADYTAEARPEEIVEREAANAFRELAYIARHALDPKVKAAAARDFADRALPKVSRNAERGDEGKSLMLPESIAVMLVEALTAAMKSRPGLPEPGPIDVTPADARA